MQSMWFFYILSYLVSLVISTWLCSCQGKHYWNNSVGHAISKLHLFLCQKKLSFWYFLVTIEKYFYLYEMAQICIILLRLIDVENRKRWRFFVCLDNIYFCFVLSGFSTNKGISTLCSLKPQVPTYQGANLITDI